MLREMLPSVTLYHLNQLRFEQLNRGCMYVQLCTWLCVRVLRNINFPGILFIPTHSHT